MNPNLPELPKVVDDICEALKQKDNFLIISHINPDGDAVGSAVAMATILQRMGKSFRLYNVSSFPESLAWASPWPVVSSLSDLAEFKPDAYIIVDCGDSKRTGDEIENVLLTKAISLSISIDHHRENPLFATHNWVDPSMAATAIMVGMLAKKLGFELTETLGQAVYLGLVSDTGSFSYANTDSRCLSLAAEIVDLGLDVGIFSASLDNTWSMERMRFWGKLFTEIKLVNNGTIAYVTVSAKMLSDAGLTVADLNDFASWMRRIKGTQVTAMIRENADAKIKVSLRSAKNVNVQKVASFFGGGGHNNAAAYETSGSLNAAVNSLLPLLNTALKEATI